MSTPERQADSRRRLRQIFDMAFEVYVSEEKAKLEDWMSTADRPKLDNWREIEWSKMWKHFYDEITEVCTSKSRREQLHNILDGICMLGMMGARIVLEKKGESDVESCM